MELQSIDIPQADSIWYVLRVLDAVQAEQTTPRAIGEFLGGKVGRQGNYYVHAARILGLVSYDPQTYAVALTPYGRALRTYDPASRDRALRHLMLRTEPMRAILVAMAQSPGLSDDEIAAIVMAIAPLSHSTALRRVRTIVSWLRDLELIAWDDIRWCYAGPRLALKPAEVPAAALAS